MVLGKSENPRFVPALRAALKAIPALPKTQKPRSLSDPSAMPAADSITDWGLFQINVQMAIARIQTRDLPPTPRMKAVAAEIGLSLSQLKDLFGVCNTLEGVTLLSRSKGRVVADRCMDMLAEMGLKGQDIKPFLKWELMPQHKVRLEATIMPRDKGIEHIIDFLCIAGGLDNDTKDLAQRQLWEFGPRVNEHLLTRIQDMAAHPQKYLKINRRGSAFICVFAAANESHDARLRPILLRFKFHKIPGIKSKWVGSHAGEAEWNIAHPSPQFY